MSSVTNSGHYSCLAFGEPLSFFTCLFLSFFTCLFVCYRTVMNKTERAVALSQVLASENTVKHAYVVTYIK